MNTEEVDFHHKLLAVGQDREMVRGWREAGRWRATEDGKREGKRGEGEGRSNFPPTYCSLILMCAGMALMNPTSFLLERTLTPQCHTFFQPGGFRAQHRNFLL